MVQNATRNDEMMSQLGRRLGAKGAVMALKVGKWAFRFMAASAMIQVYNNMIWGDAEDALPDDMRRRMHIIWWQTKGKSPEVYYFPRVGVVGDLLEWAGMDTAPSDVYDLITGKKSMQQVAESYNYGLSNLADVANKIVQSIGPQFKIPIEMLMGEKVFPSIWNRQPITNRIKYIFDNFALGSTYDGIMGNPSHKNWALREVKKSGVYSESVNRLGWLAIQQRISEYKRHAGLGKSGFITTPSGNALYNVGLAFRLGDMDAMAKSMSTYIQRTVDKLGKNIDLVSVINGAWEKLEPLNGLNDTHKRLFLASLDDREKYQLGLAYRYYAEIRSGQQFLSGKEKK
jgi:hypothetical protein